jgi:methylglyoxal synthase
MKIALIAHDNLKKSLIAFCRKHKAYLEAQDLVGTGTTSRLIESHIGLTVEKCLSGPYGGDQQIGGMIAKEEIGLVVFFRDPLTAQPHEPDVSALLRLCDVHNIPCATNKSTAELVFKALEQGKNKNV